MGMFDTVHGYVKCPHCESENEFEEQFKWSDCTLEWYELGDWIRGADRGYTFIEYNFRWDDSCMSCEKCEEKFKAYCVVRNGLIIGFLNETQMDDLDSIPDPEAGYAKNKRYSESCDKGIGKSREWEDFKSHPKSVGDKITALHTDWTIEEVYKVWVSETDERMLAFINLYGCFGRNSTDVYLYKVFNDNLGHRWLSVEDRENWSWGLEALKNMELTTEYEVRDGYSKERID